MKILIDLQYFVEINSFKNAGDCSHIYFDVFEHNTKRSFFNRCVIAGANGPITLSVPLVKGRNQRTILKELEINNEEKWQLRHWRSILSSYNSSPWFSYYKDELAGLYQRDFRWLQDWNLACTEWLINQLNLTLQLEVSRQPLSFDVLPAGFADRRKRSSWKEAAASSEAPVVYRQVFEDKTGFIPGLSIIDLLFCEGPKRSLQLLQQSVP